MPDKPYVEVTLPLILTIIAGVWAMVSTNNKRLDDMKGDFKRRLDEIIKRLDRIDVTLGDFAQRIVRLEAQASPISRR